MRTDMARLLVERYRLRRQETYHEHRRAMNDPDGPSKQGMRRPYFDRKEFNEYFAPILGFLRKSCGRPWDKVFSELNTALSGGSTIVDHVRVHVLRDFVVLQPEWHNGVPCYPYHSYGWAASEPFPIDGRFNRGFYVDRGGILRQAPHKKKPSGKAKPPRVPIDDRTAYHKIGDDWFRVWTKPLPVPGPDCSPVYDVVLKAWIKCRDYATVYRPEPLWRWYVDGQHGTEALEQLHGAQLVAYRKEQISSRTIRREQLNKRVA